MKILVLAIAAVLFTACYAPDGEGVTEEKFSTTEQAIVVCSSQCSPPTYNGNPVACASNTYCFSDAAGAYCQNSSGGFNAYTCTPNNPTYCGDGICNGTETWQTCSDCPVPVYCGDGICNGTETWQTCSDCAPPGAYCGDGICNGTETWQTCSDCAPPGPVCGDGICDRLNGEGTWNCMQDCCPHGRDCQIEVE